MCVQLWFSIKAVNRSFCPLLNGLKPLSSHCRPPFSSSSPHFCCSLRLKHLLSSQPLLMHGKKYSSYTFVVFLRVKKMLSFHQSKQGSDFWSPNIELCAVKAVLSQRAGGIAGWESAVLEACGSSHPQRGHCYPPPHTHFLFNFFSPLIIYQAKKQKAHSPFIHLPPTNKLTRMNPVMCVRVSTTTSQGEDGHGMQPMRLSFGLI